MNYQVSFFSALMEQWLIEGKFSHKETLMMASQMLAGGIDTVSLHIL